MDSTNPITPRKSKVKHTGVVGSNSLTVSHTPSKSNDALQEGNTFNTSELLDKLNDHIQRKPREDIDLDFVNLEICK